MTGAGNWTYLVPGTTSVLIDAGVGASAHLDALFSLVPAGPSQVLVTHAHPDHASGAPAVARRAPRTRFLKYPWPERDVHVPVDWQALDDGVTLAFDPGLLQVVHTPGHSPDHLAFVHLESGTAFTGDLLVQGSTVVIPASQGGVLTDYLASLERLLALGIRRALPAHGPVIDDPGALIEHYLAHRREREEQVLAVLARGAASVADIAARLYSGLMPALVPQAQDSVLAHLVKLETDGIAEDRDGRWRLRR